MDFVTGLMIRNSPSPNSTPSSRALAEIEAEVKYCEPPPFYSRFTQLTTSKIGHSTCVCDQVSYRGLCIKELPMQSLATGETSDDTDRSTSGCSGLLSLNKQR